MIDHVQFPEVGTLQAGLGKLLKPGEPASGLYRSWVAITVPHARIIAVPTALSPVYATWALKVCKKVKFPEMFRKIYRVFLVAVNYYQAQLVLILAIFHGL